MLDDTVQGCSGDSGFRALYLWLDKFENTRALYDREAWAWKELDRLLERCRREDQNEQEN